MRPWLKDIPGLEAAGVTAAARLAPAALRSPHARAVLSRTLRALIELDPEVFVPPLGGALTALLQDTSGRGGGLALHWSTTFSSHSTEPQPPLCEAVTTQVVKLSVDYCKALSSRWRAARGGA